MKLYTKTGDKGQTSLLSGKRVAKHDSRLEAYGTIDELNSFLSPIVSWSDSADINQKLASFIDPLEKSQHYLFNLGSYLACDDASAEKYLPKLETTLVTELEQKIDKMNEYLPELKNFIIPGGCSLSIAIHCARSVCRRAERCCTQTENNTNLSTYIIPFINRLSDYLFCFARYANWAYKTDDIAWDKSKI